MTSEDLELGDDLHVTKTTRRAAGNGTWVCGTIAGHRFDALVFPEHADNPDWEIGDSRITKLWVRRWPTAGPSSIGTAVPTCGRPTQLRRRLSTSSAPDWPSTFTDSRPVTINQPTRTET